MIQTFMGCTEWIYKCTTHSVPWIKSIENLYWNHIIKYMLIYRKKYRFFSRWKIKNLNYQFNYSIDTVLHCCSMLRKISIGLSNLDQIQTTRINRRTLIRGPLQSTIYLIFSSNSFLFTRRKLIKFYTSNKD